MLDNITLYRLTDTAASSTRFHAESFDADLSTRKLNVPVAVGVFPGERHRPPKNWGKRTYSTLFYWNQIVKRGHLAAFEQSGLFVAEIRNSPRTLR